MTDVYKGNEQDLRFKVHLEVAEKTFSTGKHKKHMHCRLIGNFPTFIYSP